MDAPLWVSVATALVAVSTLIYTAWSLRHKIGSSHLDFLKDEISTMKERLDHCEDNHAECERERYSLSRENVQLMRQLLKIAE